jgi:hypothetical protein
MTCSVLADRTVMRSELDGATHLPPMNKVEWSVVMLNNASRVAVSVKMQFLHRWSM